MAKNSRKPISKKLRFEIFKRDSFRCQYCGISITEPSTLLEIDHIKPVKLGGTNEIINLITACTNCNRGKAATPLTQSLELGKQLKDIEYFAERRAQLKALMSWRDELLKIEIDQLKFLNRRWHEITNYHLTEVGQGAVRRMLSIYGFDLLASAMEITKQYLFIDPKTGTIPNYSVEFAFNKIYGICFNRTKNAR